MNFVIDVGNSNMVLGIYNNNKLIHYWRVSTNRDRTADEYGIIVKQLFDYEKINFSEIDGVIISSVVPNVIISLEIMVEKHFKRRPLVVGPGVKTGINIKYNNPKEVGADRIVNAVAAYEKYGGPIIIIDFGTATTFCVVSDKGDYIGGSISPGIKISMEALFDKASKLPKVEIKKPEKVINKNTIESIQSGIVFGYIGMVKYMIDKIKSEYDSDFKEVIATGGFSKIVVSEVRSITRLDENLTLDGLNIIYKRNLEG